jgi:hypothetical protein
MKPLFLALALVVFLIPQKGFAWGDEGHSIVALVAQQILMSQSQTDASAATALKTVAGILGSTKIDEAATWPDKVKNESRECNAKPYVKDPTYSKGGKTGMSSAVCDAYKYTSGWHFINSDASEYILNPSAPDHFKGDMVILIRGLSHILKGENADVLNGVTSFANWKRECLKKEDPNPSLNCKKEALEFLIHYVGDIHQPLHGGADCDLGANTQFITFFGLAKDAGAYWCKPADGPDCNNQELHQAWDTNLLRHDPGGSPFTTNANYVSKIMRTLAKSREGSDSKRCVRTPPDVATSIDEPNGPIGWVNESLCYMQQIYTFPDDPKMAKNEKNLDGNRSVAQVVNFVPNRCRVDKKVATTRGSAYSPVIIADKYYATNIATINERLYWGGYRLANLLKDIYGKGDKLADISKVAPN